MGEVFVINNGSGELSRLGSENALHVLGGKLKDREFVQEMNKFVCKNQDLHLPIDGQIEVQAHQQGSQTGSQLKVM